MVTVYMYDVLYGEVKDVLSAKTTARLQFAILHPLDLQTYQDLHYILSVMPLVTLMTTLQEDTYSLDTGVAV